MLSIYALALLLICTNSLTYEDFTTKQQHGIKLIEGFSNGYFGNEIQIGKCLLNQPWEKFTLINDYFSKGYEDFKNGFTFFSSGMSNVGKALNEMKSIIQTCEGAEFAYAIADLFAKLSNPSMILITFSYKLYSYKDEIY